MGNSYDMVYDRRRMFRILALGSLTTFTLSMDTTMATTTLPRITEALGTTLSMSSLIMVLFLVGLVSFIPLVGKIADCAKIRETMIIGLLLFTAATLICASSNSIYTLIAAILFQGIGASVLAAAPPIIVATFMPTEKKGFGMGVVTTFMGAGMILGPLWSGFMIDHFAWNFLFLSLIPFGAVCMLMAIFWLPEPREIPEGKKLKLFNAVLLFLTILTFVLSFAFLLDPSTVDAWVRIVMLVAFLILLPVCIYVERKSGTERLINVDVLRNKNVFLIALSILFVSMMANGTYFIVPYYLSVSLGLSGTQCGLILSFAYFFTCVTSVVIGNTCDRFGCKPAALMMAFLRVIFCIGALIISPETGAFLIITLMVVYGLSSGLANVSQNTSVMHHSPRGIQADSSAVAAIMSYLGSSLGTVVYNASIVMTIPESASVPISELSPDLIVDAMHITSSIGLMLCAIAFILLMVVPNIIPKKDKTEEDAVQ